MRALDCVCDEHLRADNDEELFERSRERADRDHPELRLGEERLRELVARVPYDGWWTIAHLDDARATGVRYAGVRKKGCDGGRSSTER